MEEEVAKSEFARLLRRDGLWPFQASPWLEVPESALHNHSEEVK